jgi:hypothetical protein
MDVDPRSRAIGNALVGPEERGLSLEGVALGQFIELLKTGPRNERLAPGTITLPDSLCAALRGAATATYNDGLEHGGVFGYFAGEPVKFGILYAAGQETQIAYPSANTWPALRFLGRFHTHLYVLALQRGVMQVGGWAGGGPSGADLTNFLANEGNASIVFAQTKWSAWKIYFLLRPQESHLRGGPVTIGKNYEQRVVAAVAKGADPIDASDDALKDLARSGAFVFYSAVDTGFEAGGRLRTGSVVLSRQS